MSDSVNHNKLQRRAFTLVELLIVLAIISVLAGIALPTAKNTLKGQRLSRAATLVQSAIEEARARSISQGGGGGIMIERRGIDNLLGRSESIQMRFAVAPPAYNGEAGVPKPLLGIRLDPDPPPPAVQLRTIQRISLWFDASASQLVRSANDIANGSTPTLINRGDVVQLGDSGLPMAIETIRLGNDSLWIADFGMPVPVGVITTTMIRVELRGNELNSSFLRFRGERISFSITRSPRSAIASPIELPRGTAIDLTASGIGRFGNQFSPMWAEFNYLDTSMPPFTNVARDYQSIFIIFGARGEVNRVITSQGDGSGGVQLFELPILGDVHFLVGDAGQVKTLPSDQLEDTDPNPLADEAKDGKTPLLNSEAIWVTVRSRNGDILTSPWIDPTDDATNLIPAPVTTPTDQDQQDRIRAVIGRTRTAAVESRDTGSL